MKRSKTTALLLMSTVPLLLTACSSEPEVQVQEGLYTSVEACSEATGDRRGRGDGHTDEAGAHRGLAGSTVLRGVVHGEKRFLS